MTMTTIVMEGAVEVDVAIEPGHFAAALSQAINQQAPIMTVPLISGEGYLVLHHIVGFAPKGSSTFFKVGQRAQQQATAARQQRKGGAKR